MIEQRLEQDLKTAMLARESFTVTTLRGLKSTILNVKVAAGTRDKPLPDNEVIALFSKEAKKRQEAASMYVQGGSIERADAELAEKAIIEAYLPAQLSEREVATIIEATIADEPDAAFGQIISIVRQKTNGSADGAVIARLVKEKLQ
ncbi:GatB/YqeY domain-containing protein [Candidatus Saccharibacteria bacterium]|nr:GatB/YqeY domain-containing protein [Candidatus Saccharibacteria bacterium]